MQTSPHIFQGGHGELQDPLLAGDDLIPGGAYTCWLLSQERVRVPGGRTDISATLVQEPPRSTCRLCVLLSPGVAEVAR